MVILFLQKYNHMQPPDADVFSMMDVILNQVTNLGMKITHTSLEF